MTDAAKLRTRAATPTIAVRNTRLTFSTPSRQLIKKLTPRARATAASATR